MSNYKAQIVSINEEIREKSNGGQVQLCQALILDGPLKGLTVLSQRTILNSKGVEKPAVKIGQDVLLYHTQLESTSKPGTMQNFFEVSASAGATQDDINEALNKALAMSSKSALAEQAI